ncbi:hypothetical protein [Candidatus Protochlamydia phocaeensis]|nr:hypothetical protein [Candidatus Protochlamydia phocaeensis]
MGFGKGALSDPSSFFSDPSSFFSDSSFSSSIECCLASFLF